MHIGRIALIATAGAVSLSLLWPQGGIAQDKKDSMGKDTMMQGEMKSDMKKDTMAKDSMKKDDKMKKDEMMMKKEEKK